MQQTHAAKVCLKRLHKIFGQHGHAVLRAFAVAHQHLPVGEVDVLHTQRQALDLPQARSIKEADHQPADPIDIREHAPDFGLGQHGRQAHGPLRPDEIGEPGKLLAEHLLVKKKERRERLILRRRRDVTLGGEPAQERRHLRRTHLARVALAVEEDEPADPVPVRLLGAPTVMQRTHHFPKPLAQPFCPTVRRQIRFGRRIRFLTHFAPAITPRSKLCIA